MTKTHRAVLVAGLLALAASSLYVPWHNVNPQGVPYEGGYTFVWDLVWMQIHFGQLFLSWVVIAALTGGAYLALGLRRRTSPTDGEGSSK